MLYSAACRTSDDRDGFLPETVALFQTPLRGPLNGSATFTISIPPLQQWWITMSHTSPSVVAGLMHLALEQLLPNDGIYDDHEENEQCDVQQGHHGLDDGVQDHLQACSKKQVKSPHIPLPLSPLPDQHHCPGSVSHTHSADHLLLHVARKKTGLAQGHVENQWQREGSYPSPNSIRAFFLPRTFHADGWGAVSQVARKVLKTETLSLLPSRYIWISHLTWPHRAQEAPIAHSVLSFLDEFVRTRRVGNTSPE